MNWPISPASFTCKRGSGKTDRFTGGVFCKTERGVSAGACFCALIMGFGLPSGNKASLRAMKRNIPQITSSMKTPARNSPMRNQRMPAGLRSARS